MVKIGEFWQYMMHRKAQFGLLLMALLLGIGCGAKLMSLHRSETFGLAQETSGLPSYANTLRFRINGANGKPSYELQFNANYTNANVKIYDNPTSTATRIKVYGQHNALVSSEETTFDGTTYKFTKAPTSYNISLQPGYTLEFTGSNIQVISDLTGGIATDFMPSSTNERYVVMAGGLRKERWGTGTGEQMMYRLVQTYFGNQIAAYRAKISPAVLNNKYADTAKKAQIIAMYNALDPRDRPAYGEFVEKLKRGGTPEITYLGKSQYNVGAKVDLAQLVKASDGEDGEYPSEKIRVETNLNTAAAGEYYVAYTVSDSDNNTLTKKVTIKVVATATATNSSSNLSSETGNNNLPSQNEISATGSGSNLDTTKKNNLIEIPEDSTIWDGNTELATPEAMPSAASVIVPAVTTDDSESPESRSGITASQIVLLVLGIVLVLGLVRFIFDHYVR